MTIRRSQRSICIALSVDAMRFGPHGLDGWLCKDGKPLSGQEVYDILAEAKAKGYDVLPPCDDHDDHGHCKGHVEHFSIYT